MGLLRLIDYLDVDLLQDLQDNLAALGRVCLLTCDEKGIPMTAPSSAGRPRALVPASGDAHAAIRASEDVRVGESSDGFASDDHAAPIVVFGRQLGVVIATDLSDELIEAEHLGAVAARCGPSADGLRDAFGPQPRERLGTASCPHTLAHIIGTLCEQRFAMRRRLEGLSTVCDLTDTLSGAGDLGEIMDATASRISAMMNVKACGIRGVDPETGELVSWASHNLSQKYLEKGAIRLADNPIDAAALAGENVYIEDAPNDPRVRFPDEARREGLVSGLCVPMAYRGEVVGVLRVYSGHRQRFTPFEVALLRAVGSQVAGAVTNARLYREQLEAERYRRQMDYAAEIQRRMIPPVPNHPRISFGAVYDPRLEVGGDLYDFIELPGGSLGVCIADVVGKGVPAALLMASVRAGLRAHADSVYNINEIMARLNVRLCRDTQVSEFTTMFYGVFSPDGSQLTYCNAGHEPPLLLRNGDLFRLQTGGMVIGIDPNEGYRMDVVDLKPDDVLVMVTDGITEALDFNDEPFGRERLVDSVRRYRHLPARILAQQLLWDVRRFCGLAEKTDDRTLVVARIQ